MFGSIEAKVDELWQPAPKG